MSILERMRPIDLAVIAGYVLVMALIGFWASRKVRSAKDFTSAGQQLTWKMVAGSTIATSMGANMVIGKYDLIFESGLAGLTSSLFWWVGWALLLVMVKKLRVSGVASLPAFLEQKYNPTTRKICSYCVLVTVVGSCAASFLTLGTILEALGICNRVVGTWIGAAFTILYTVFSGLWGVTLTDTIQSLILLVAFGLVFPIAVFQVAGGWDAVAAANTPERLNLFTGIAPITMVGWAVSNCLAVGAEPNFSQRIFCSKSTKDAFLGQALAWIATLVVSGVVSALPGLAIQKIFPDLTMGSEFTPLFIVSYLPAVLSGLILAALLGLVLTSADTYLLTLSSTVMDDIVAPRFPRLSDRRRLLLTRLTCVLSAAVICAMALYVDKIYQLFKTGSGAYGAGVFFPLILGCFWKKANAKAINIGMLAGCFVSFAFDLFLKIPLQWDIDGCIIGAPLCLLICVVGSLAANRSNQSRPLPERGSC